MERLNAGREITYELGGDKTPTPSEEEEESGEINSERPVKKLVPGDFEEIDKLCKEVWPALAVMGGVDSGLLVGRKCIQKSTGKKGIVLGMLRKGTNCVKVQWEDPDHGVGYGYQETKTFSL